MIDEKEQLINEVVQSMTLSDQDTQKLRDVLWIKMYNYSLVKIKNTDIVIRNTTLNKEALRMFFCGKKRAGMHKENN